MRYLYAVALLMATSASALLSAQENGDATPMLVKEIGGVEAPNGLGGRHIALWQSHGRYFDQKQDRWKWQRARIFQTVEDLYTQSYVMPFLTPMLQNAGAYVLSPRERDTNSVEIIVDGDGGYAFDGYSETHGKKKWKKAKTEGFGYKTSELHNGENPFKMGHSRVVDAVNQEDKLSTARWSAEIPKTGQYAVYVSYSYNSANATDAHYIVHTRGGDRQFRVNQQMGCGTWVYLGHFQLEKGHHEIVELTNQSADKKAVISADAVKIGGGMGNVARIVNEPSEDVDYQYQVSGDPRWLEGSRYWLQWAGMPDSVFTPNNYGNDYNDDYQSRALWVNYLAGGSKYLPKSQGLNIPVDLAFAFHSDAGTTKNDSIIGTLGIYCTIGTKYGDGRSRSIARQYTDGVMSQVVGDIRATFEPRWTRREMWDKSYYEARAPQVPTMLLELLSHQNFADMKYGLDPEFRFVVSRAVYKGMLKFLAKQDGRSYIVQPLPVRSFEIRTTQQSGEYLLTWSETRDSLETSAKPSYYVVEERIGDGVFTRHSVVTDTCALVKVSDSHIHSYRIIAGNDGGVSFPSEILALCHKGNGAPVLVVNGFTRVSAPDWFDTGSVAGFNVSKDGGVPYIQDIAYVGPQIDFDKESKWKDDDAPGFGASRATYENRVIAGNTFDYVYEHGEAIAHCGQSFISSSMEAYLNSTAENQIVDLILGKQKEIKQGRGAFGTKFKTFPKKLQEKLTAHLQAGGDLMVSGAYVASDLWNNEFSSASVAAADKKFASEVLGYTWRVGQASADGKVKQVTTRYKAFGEGNYQFSNELNEGCYAVESPDGLYATDSKKGATFLRYGENNVAAGSLLDHGNYRVVVMGFPFETIKGSDARNKLMSQIISFFVDKAETKKSGTR